MMQYSTTDIWGFTTQARARLLTILNRVPETTVGYIGGSDTLPAPLSHEEELALMQRLKQRDPQVKSL